MEERIREMCLVPPGEESEESVDVPAGSRFTASDLDTARELAAYHRLMAAELPPHSQIRGLVLRCAGHWSRLGEIPRNGLAEVGGREDF